MTLTQQQTVQAGGATADMPRSSASAQAYLRPAAAQVVSQEHSEGAAEVMLAAETEVPIMESIEQEIERLQRLEQRSARLQSSPSGEAHPAHANSTLGYMKATSPCNLKCTMVAQK